MGNKSQKLDFVWLIFFIIFLGATLLSIFHVFLTQSNTAKKLFGTMGIELRNKEMTKQNTKAFWSDKTAHSVKITDEETLSMFYAYQEHDNVSATKVNAESTLRKKMSLLNTINVFIDAIIFKMNWYADNYIFSKESMVLLNAYAKDRMGLYADDIAADNLVQDPNGYWVEPVKYGDCTQTVENTIEFSKYLENSGIDFLYFETPHKFDEKAYVGLEKDYSRQISNEVNTALRDAGVSIISMEELVNADESIDKLSLFYKTDHHWLPQTALEAASLLGNYLNENCGFQIDTSLFGLDNYTITTLDNFYLGSYGRKLTTVLADKDDFDILTPNYETDLTVYASMYDNVLRGNIQGTLLYQEQLMKGVLEQNKYYYYGGADQALIQVHNNNISDGKRLLIIKVSTSVLLIPYLAATVEYLDIIDLRAYDGSLKDFIESTNPDAVAMIYQASLFRTPKPLFDFE